MSRALVTALVVTGCSGGPLLERGEPAPASSAIEAAGHADAPEPGPVLGHLQLRDRRLTFFATAGGPRFTVRTASGALVAGNLDAAELSAREPALFDLYRTAQAGLLDASLTLPAR